MKWTDDTTAVIRLLVYALNVLAAWAVRLVDARCDRDASCVLTVGLRRQRRRRLFRHRRRLLRVGYRH